MARFFRQTFQRDDGSLHEEEMIGIPRGDFDESVHVVTDEDRQMYREEYAAFLKPPETPDKRDARKDAEIAALKARVAELEAHTPTHDPAPEPKVEPTIPSAAPGEPPVPPKEP